MVIKRTKPTISDHLPKMTTMKNSQPLKYIPYWFCMLFFLLNMQFVNAQELSPKAFDEWIDEEYSRLAQGESIDTDQIADRVIDRFEKGLYITDDAVINSTKFFEIKEFSEKGKELTNGKTPFIYSETTAYINQLLGKLYKRDLLKVKLLERKSRLLQTRTDKNEEVEQLTLKTLSTLIVDLEVFNTDIDKLYNKSMIILGQIYLENDNKTQADKHFAKVLKYPFYNVTKAKDYSDLRNLYIQAGLGRIAARKGNLKKLKELYFIPSAAPDLYPSLKASIEEVGGTWDNRSNLNIRNN